MENGEVKAKQTKKRSRRTSGASGFETLRAEAVRPTTRPDNRGCAGSARA